MVRELWFAVNGNGRWNVFVECPTRNERFKVWEGDNVYEYDGVVCLFECDGFVLPQIKWNDDPIKMELKLEY